MRLANRLGVWMVEGEKEHEEEYDEGPQARRAAALPPGMAAIDENIAQTVEDALDAGYDPSAIEVLLRQAISGGATSVGGGGFAFSGDTNVSSGCGRAAGVGGGSGGSNPAADCAMLGPTREGLRRARRRQTSSSFLAREVRTWSGPAHSLTSSPSSEESCPRLAHTRRGSSRS